MGETAVDDDDDDEVVRDKNTLGPVLNKITHSTPIHV